MVERRREMVWDRLEEREKKLNEVNDLVLSLDNKLVAGITEKDGSGTFLASVNLI